MTPDQCREKISTASSNMSKMTKSMASTTSSNLMTKPTTEANNRFQTIISLLQDQMEDIQSEVMKYFSLSELEKMVSRGDFRVGKDLAQKEIDLRLNSIGDEIYCRFEPPTGNGSYTFYKIDMTTARDEDNQKLTLKRALLHVLTESRNGQGIRYDEIVVKRTVTKDQLLKMNEQIKHIQDTDKENRLEKEGEKVNIASAEKIFETEENIFDTTSVIVTEKESDDEDDEDEDEDENCKNEKEVVIHEFRFYHFPGHEHALVEDEEVELYRFFGEEIELDEEEDCTKKSSKLWEPFMRSLLKGRTCLGQKDPSRNQLLVEMMVKAPKAGSYVFMNMGDDYMIKPGTVLAPPFWDWTIDPEDPTQSKKNSIFDEDYINDF